MPSLRRLHSTLLRTRLKVRFNVGGASFTPAWGEEVAPSELYNYSAEGEARNCEAEGAYASLRAALRARLQKGPASGWGGDRP